MRHTVSWNTHNENYSFQTENCFGISQVNWHHGIPLKETQNIKIYTCACKMIKYYLLSPLSSSNLRHATQNQQKQLCFVDSSFLRINWQFFIWSAYNLRVTAALFHNCQLGYGYLVHSLTQKQTPVEHLAHALQNCKNLYFLCRQHSYIMIRYGLFQRTIVRPLGLEPKSTNG